LSHAGRAETMHGYTVLPQWNGVRISHPMDPRIDLSTVEYALTNAPSGSAGEITGTASDVNYYGNHTQSLDHFLHLMDVSNQCRSFYQKVALVVPNLVFFNVGSRPFDLSILVPRTILKSYVLRMARMLVHQRDSRPSLQRRTATRILLIQTQIPNSQLPVPHKMITFTNLRIQTTVEPKVIRR
jgi:hypothetical protein